MGEPPSAHTANIRGEPIDDTACASAPEPIVDRDTLPRATGAVDDRETQQRAAPGGRPVLAANRLNVAALRRATPIRMWGGKGSGLPCDFCRVLVGPGDVEYEVEAQLDGAVVMLRFHYRCHYAWTGGDEPRVAAERA